VCVAMNKLVVSNGQLSVEVASVGTVGDASESFTTNPCFNGAAANEQDCNVHDHYEAFLDTLDKRVFGIHGDIDDFGVGLNVHRDIEAAYVENPERFVSVLYRINQSRDLFGLFPLVPGAATYEEPKPRP